MFKTTTLLLAGILASTSATAQVTVDGTRDAAYGAAKSTVLYDPTSPESNFATPSATTRGASYDIYFTSDATNVYGFLQTTGAGVSAGDFANLYFDIDPGNGATSDVVYEITNQRGVVGGVSFPAPINFFQGPGVIEFALPNSYFGPQAPGATVFLRMSQSFGYSVVGGSSFGADGLAAITIGGAPASAVPEPASWAMMMIGFGAVGGALRRRKRPALAVA